MTDSPSSGPSKPPFTSVPRILCIIALTLTAWAMYWVLKTDTIDGMMKLVAGSGILMAGLLIIAAGAHYSDKRHHR